MKLDAGRGAKPTVARVMGEFQTLESLQDLHVPHRLALRLLRAAT